jgi:hypothetical protein
VFVAEELAPADRHLLRIGVRERHGRASRIPLLLHSLDMRFAASKLYAPDRSFAHTSPFP